MFKVERIKEDSSEKIKIYNSMMTNLLDFNVEYYQEDNLLFPDYALEYSYKFEIHSSILKNMSTSNHIMLCSYNSLIMLDNSNDNYRGYKKVLKLKQKPKKVKREKLLLYFNNNNLYLLEAYNIKTQLGVVVDEGDDYFILSYIDPHYTKTVKRAKKNYKIIKEFNLNKIFTLTILVKVDIFNEISEIYYTTNFVMKDEITL